MADRRVERTRRTLREALIELVLERGWDAVTVQDVCERADVGRSTFYSHYADREDLLLSGFDDLKRWLRAEGCDERPLAFTRRLVAHVEENRRLFRAVVGRRSGHVVQKRFHAVLLEMVEEDLAGWPEREPTARFLVGGLVDVLSWWLDTRSALGADEVDALFHRLAGPVLASAGGLRAQQAVPAGP